MNKSACKVGVAIAIVFAVTGCEKRWEAVEETSKSVSENSMLAATRILERRQYKVETVPTLSSALHKTIPKGTMIIAEQGGMVSPGQADKLLAWVKEGNTLITRPKSAPDDSRPKIPDPDSSSDDETETDADTDTDTAKEQRGVKVESDPIGAYLGVVRDYRWARTKKLKKQKEQEAGSKPDPATTVPSTRSPIVPESITLPNAAYPLQLHPDVEYLYSTQNTWAPVFSDEKAELVRVYPEGKGHIVLLANNYFTNDDFFKYDHAELLLGLTALNPDSRNVLIVQHLDVESWLWALWSNFKLLIVSLACGIALLFWAAIRRFGPLLPEPAHDRRALMEHIDASGRWLWKLPGGRNILLAAARTSTFKVLQNRQPELQRMTTIQQVNRLAQSCDMDKEDLILALQEPASQLPSEFTRQIRTLQQLRKFHER